jgi:hypothetical protein
VLTVFSVPKPFTGPIADLQARAVASWKEVHPDVQVVLVGDEAGVAEAAVRAGVEHLPAVSRGPGGTPRVDDAFGRVDKVARHRLRCFANADIVFGRDLIAAVERVARSVPRFLIVGETRDLDARLLDGDAHDRRSTALERGVPRGPAALDWFVFPVGHLDPIPPFVVGRAGYDNWLVWRGRQRGPVIDASRAVVAIHQTHDYEHVAGGKDGAYYGPEAAANLELAGGSRHVYTLLDASHTLGPDLALRRNLRSTLRAAETLRKAKWKLGRR